MKRGLFLILCISLICLDFNVRQAMGVEKLLLPVPKDEIIEPLMVNYTKILQKDLPGEYRRVSRYKISAVDPTFGTNKKGAYFPGYRGPDQLIVYTPKFGEYTTTNEYGKEATVRDEQVSGFNGANSYIPANGYVISGHGAAKRWINQNLIEGAFVKIDFNSMTIEAVITPQSYFYKADHRINEVKNVILDFKKTLPGYQYSSAQKYYSEALEKLEKAKYKIIDDEEPYY